ncbi:MAG: tRNA adenosine(34) deaminase TadA [Deltaproteobacteria bacterium]|jgi:tRNA(adenine34) deaminase|nr:MAG: tRNA adenosine(34) deaminase TadA [Deltaproteobacteria bacterium]
MDIHTELMKEALAEARKAGEKGEVPVGAVLISSNGELLAKAHNESISRNDPTAHAEILALRKAGKKLGNYRISNSTFYVTIEPCIMCIGALINARIRHLVYGARDPKAGAVDSVYNILQNPRLNHRMKVSSGILERECRDIIQSFFKRLRDNTS